MVAWKIVYTNQAKKDADKLKTHGLKSKGEAILEVLSRNPFELPYEELVGDLKGVCSRRINIQHRIIYQIDKKENR